jgi:hypothetical protein
MGDSAELSHASSAWSLEPKAAVLRHGIACRRASWVRTISWKPSILLQPAADIRHEASPRQCSHLPELAGKPRKARQRSTSRSKPESWPLCALSHAW